MSNIVDRRRIVARSNEQEYAHQYPFEGKSEEYQYAKEDKRVRYHANDPDDEKTQEELYNVQPTQTQTQPTNRLRVRMTNQEVLEENKQRSYKILPKSPVWDKMDVGPEGYALQNDPREDEVNAIQESSSAFAAQIEEESNLPLNTPAGRTVVYKEEEPTEEVDFEVGMKVAHIEEGIKGEIKFVGEKSLSVVWEDNTRERFDVKTAKQSLNKISYVDTTQQQVAPLETPSFPNNEISPIVEQALNALSEEEVDNESDVKTAGKIDIEKLKLQRKADNLQNQLDAIDVEKIKKKAATELIDLMQKKGMIKSAQDSEQQFENIMKMDDIGFEAFKNVILATQTNSAPSDVDDVLAVLEEDDFSDIEDGQEYALAKEAMKKATTPKRPTSVDGIEMGDTSFFENGGLKNFKPVVGGFEGNSPSGEKAESRSLSAANKQHKAIERKSGNGLDLSSFEGIQGIKTPINIPAREATRSSTYAELFSGLQWNMGGK